MQAVAILDNSGGAEASGVEWRAEQILEAQGRNEHGKICTRGTIGGSRTQQDKLEKARRNICYINNLECNKYKEDKHTHDPPRICPGFSQ